ncbi:CU044_5270 family protein [Actinomadura sp. 3N407]|uniref:CU044_5270 family protein n=1 Tax=Actinomadura sp. 3N407 TaxID=3457423 RepID=UPI003FCC7324
MDELRTVREAYGEPAPPTMQEMTEARARMLDDPPRRRLFSGWRFKVGMGALAAGAAAAVAIATVGSGSPASPGPPASGVDLGRRAVLAAAEKAEAQPAGKYWHSDVISGQSYVVRSKSGAAYAIVGAHSELFGWHGVKPGMGGMYYDRDLPARPLTARDEELWRKDGSPSSFRVWSGDKHLTFTTEPTKWRSDVPGTGPDPLGAGRFALGKSAQELQNLPTDPAELTKMFLDGGAEWEKLRSAGIDPRVLPNLQIQKVGALLGGPTPPKVRAGLIRALAAQPGVHAIGQVTDPMGRQGVALAGHSLPTTDDGEFGTPKSEQGTYQSRIVIVFDKRSGALMSRHRELTDPGGLYWTQKPGFVINYEVFRSSGWTNTKPSPPAEQPFRLR